MPKHYEQEKTSLFTRNIMSEKTEAIQDLAWPEGTCFGCGPANPDGLQLKSHLAENEGGLIATFTPQDTHDAGIPNVMCGGIAATLIDCHSAWTVYTLKNLDAGRPLNDLSLTQESRDAHTGANYVTGELTVRYQQPTPLDQPVLLQSWINGDIGKKTTVRCELGPEGEVTATGEAIIIRIE